MVIRRIENASPLNVVNRSQKSIRKEQNFTGNAAKIVEDGTLVQEFLPAKTILEKLKSCEFLKGELGGILLTAIGTGCVAPIFIGTNPFVKAPKGATEEEKKEVVNTKWYTAMRQPISAALAIIFQVSALKPIGMVLDEIVNNDKYARYWNPDFNHSRLNNDDYIKRVNKDKLKGQSKAKQKEIIDGIKKEQLDKIIEEFKTTHKIQVGMNPKNETEKLYVKNETIGKLINDQISSYQKDAKALKFEDANRTKYLDRAETLMNHDMKTLFKDVPTDEINKLQKDLFNKIYTESKEDSGSLKELKTKIRNNLKNPNKLQKLLEKTTNKEEKQFVQDCINLNNSLNEQYNKTTEVIQKLLENEKDTKIKEVLQEILNKPKDLRAHRVQRTLERIEKIKEACNGNYSRENYKNAILERNTLLDSITTDLEDLKIKDFKNLKEEDIKQLIEQISQKCCFDKDRKPLVSLLRDTYTFDNDAGKLKEKIYKDIVKGYKKFIDNKYKFHSQITKVLIGVCITLPITCNALNWVYPRFMEKFFPELAGVKQDKDKGGNK